jgi:hypothetical protein
MREFARLAVESPHVLEDAPVSAPVRRLDETRAARQLVPRWQPSEETARG